MLLAEEGADFFIVDSDDRGCQQCAETARAVDKDWQLRPATASRPRCRPTVTDESGRSCLQLAENCKGNRQRLATWLRDSVETVVQTHGYGRAPEDKTRVSVLPAIRAELGSKHSAEPPAA